MSSSYEEGAAGTYRTRDPAANLRIKVSLRKVTAASSTPSNSAPENEESTTFTWQQKVFSEHEIEVYGNQESVTDALSERYHKEVAILLKRREKLNASQKTLNAAAAPLARTRLFTYVDHDDFVDVAELSRKVTTSSKEQPSFLVERMQQVRRRHGDRRATPHSRDADVRHPVAVQDRNTARFAASRVVDTPFQIMYIMADLRREGDEANASPELDEHVLATVRIDANGVLEVRPDFNSGRSAYRIETYNGEIFEYTLEHASKDISQPQRAQEVQAYTELYEKRAELLHNRVGVEFAKAPTPTGSVRVHVFGEVISAQHFEYDDLYVHVLQEFPEGWEPLEDMSRLSVSQISKRTYRDDADGVCYFAYPFELCAIYRAQDSPYPIKWPLIYFRVCSLDGWDRHRTEGYGYLQIPSTAGTYERTVDTWRPEGASVKDEMRRFFIGGAPELEDDAYVSIPAGHDGPVLSKFGLRTVSSGSVRFRLNVMQHWNKEVGHGKDAPTGTLGAVVSDMSQSTAMVLEAFKRAQARMMKIRGGGGVGGAK